MQIQSSEETKKRQREREKKIRMKEKKKKKKKKKRRRERDKYLIKKGGLKEIFSIFTRLRNRKDVEDILPDVPVELFMRGSSREEVACVCAIGRINCLPSNKRAEETPLRDYILSSLSLSLSLFKILFFLSTTHGKIIHYLASSHVNKRLSGTTTTTTTTATPVWLANEVGRSAVLAARLLARGRQEYQSASE